jgi:hypothetical protein
MNFLYTYHLRFVHYSLVVLLILTKSLSGQQDSSSRWSLNISPQMGFIIPHHASLEHLIQGHSVGVHVYANRKVDGSRHWHRAYNFPECGLDISVINSGNKQQLGNQFSSSYLVNLPLNKGKYRIGNGDNSVTRFRHWIGLGIGMGYSTQRWDLETNHQAPMLGSRINAAISLQYSVRLVSFNNGDLRAGFRILHFSNGAFQLPNLGTNNAGVFMSYAAGKRSHEVINSLSLPIVEKYIMSAGLSAGLKEILPPNGRKYIASVVSFLGERRLSYKSAFGIGLDVLCDLSAPSLVEQRSGIRPETSLAVQLGGLLSYSLFFDRLSLKIQQGFYLRDSLKLNGSLYHRFGLRYVLSDRMFAQLSLKTHFAKADYGELGIGYLLRK